MPDLVLSSDLDAFLATANDAAARTELGLGTGDSPQFTAVNIGAASDTTVTRVSAGVIAVEGATIYAQGGALGTPASGTLTNCTGLPQAGTVGLTTADSPTFAGLTVTTATATTANVTTFRVLDSVDQSHGLQFVVGSNLTANRTLTFTTGDANRAVTIQGDVTLPAGTALVSSGALGTPSSGTLTNCTGLPASGISAGVLGGNITLGESTGQIILDAALSADGTWSGICEAGTAGATLAFGDLVYLAAADSRWELADADAASTSGDVILGFCVLAAAADGDPTTILYRGKIRADAAFPDLTIGAPVYAGTTAGDVQVAQPSGTDDVIRRVGWGKTANELIVDIEPNYVTHT